MIMKLFNSTQKVLLIVGLLFFAMLLTSCELNRENTNTGESSSRTKIGIIAAMPCEIELISNSLENKSVEIIAGTEYYSGEIGNYDVILMQCGMGKVSAGAGAQAMITAYHPDYIINTGCAGALSQALNVGDIVIADHTIEWDLDTIDIGNPRGYVTALDKIEMTADEDLSDKIIAVFDDNENITRGLIVSGDQFVSKDEQRELILSAFPDALCTEMEGAAIGHVCEQNQVPFCIIRCMSDNANGNSGVNFAEFSKEAGQKSASYLIKFLNEQV